MTVACASRPRRHLCQCPAAEGLQRSRNGALVGPPDADARGLQARQGTGADAADDHGADILAGDRRQRLAAAVAMVLLRYAHEQYTSSHLYVNDEEDPSPIILSAHDALDDAHSRPDV